MIAQLLRRLFRRDEVQENAFATIAWQTLPRDVGVGKRILVVDDEPNIVRFMEKYLVLYGYEVTSALSGQEALDKISAERPDLLVTDLMMPGMDGLELIDTLRDDRAVHDLPIVLLNARAPDVDVFSDERYHNATVVLTKPFNQYEFVTIVTRLLKPPAPAA